MPLWVIIAVSLVVQGCEKCRIELNQIEGLYEHKYSLGEYPGWSPHRHYEVHSNYSSWFEIDPLSGVIQVMNYFLPPDFSYETSIPVYVYDWQGVNQCTCSLSVWQITGGNVNNSLVTLVVKYFNGHALSKNLKNEFENLYKQNIIIRIIGVEEYTPNYHRVHIIVGVIQNNGKIHFFNDHFIEKLLEYQKMDVLLHFRVEHASPIDCHSFSHSSSIVKLSLSDTSPLKYPLILPLSIIRNSTCYCPPAYGGSTAIEENSDCNVEIPQCVDGDDFECLPTLEGELRIKTPEDRHDCIYFESGTDSHAVLAVEITQIFTISFEFSSNSGSGIILGSQSGSTKLTMKLLNWKIHLDLAVEGQFYSLVVKHEQLRSATWIFTEIRLHGNELSVSVGRSCNVHLEEYNAVITNSIGCSASTIIHNYLEIRNSVVVLGGDGHISQLCVRRLNIDGRQTHIGWEFGSPLVKLGGSARIGCEQMEDKCRDDSPCLNGGVCRNVWNGFVCDCKDGFYTKQCGRRQTNAGKSIKFNSQSSSEIGNFKERTSVIVLAVKTVSPIGGNIMVVTSNTTQEYIAISINNNGSLCFRRGDVTRQFTQQNRINDGQWYTIHVVMFNKTCFVVIVDYGAYETEWLNVDGFDFRGAFITLGYHHVAGRGVGGCFKNIRYGEEGHIIGDISRLECINQNNCETLPCPHYSFCQNDWWSRGCICHKGYFGSACQPICSTRSLNPCKGSSLCIHDPHHPRGYKCKCTGHYGPSCEYKLPLKCPRGRWGDGCYPCECPPSLGYQSQCTPKGECICRKGHYFIDRLRGCISCDCFGGGTIKGGCNNVTGQCYCRPHIIGLKCDTCHSPYKQVSLNCSGELYACPSLHLGGINWPRGIIGEQYILPCEGLGTATMKCGKRGWEKPSLSNCSSIPESNLSTEHPGSPEYAMLHSLQYLTDYSRHNSYLFEKDVKVICNVLNKLSTIESEILLKNSLIMVEWLITAYRDFSHLRNICGVFPIQFIPNKYNYSVKMSKLEYASTYNQSSDISIYSENPGKFVLLDGLRFDDDVIVSHKAVGVSFPSESPFVIKFPVDINLCGYIKKCRIFPFNRSCTTVSQCSTFDNRDCTVDCSCSGNDIVVILGVDSFDWTMRPVYRKVNLAFTVMTAVLQIFIAMFIIPAKVLTVHYIIGVGCTTSLLAVNFIDHFVIYSAIILISYSSIINCLILACENNSGDSKTVHSLCYVLSLGFTCYYSGVVLIIYGIHVPLTVKRYKSSIFSFSILTLSFIILAISHIRRYSEVNGGRCILGILEHLQWLLYFLSKLEDFGDIDVLFYILMFIKTVIFTASMRNSRFNSVGETFAKLIKWKTTEGKVVAPYSQTTLLHQNHIYQSVSSQGFLYYSLVGVKFDYSL